MNMRTTLVAGIAAWMAFVAGSRLCGAQAAGFDKDMKSSPADLVNVFTGTSNSRWMLFPGATVPMGLVKLSPDNQGNVWDGGYEYTVASIAGFSFLHSMGLGSMTVMPLVGPLENEPGQPKLFAGPSDGPFAQMWTAGYRSRIRKDTEQGRPGYYAVDLVDAQTHVELTATARTGWMRFHFPTSEQTHLVFDFGAPAEEQTDRVAISVEQTSTTEIVGSMKQGNQYAGEYTVYFVAQFSQPFTGMGAWQNGEYKGDAKGYGMEWRTPRTVQARVTSFQSERPGGVWLDFASKAAEPVVMRTGISLVSMAGARANLAVEGAPHGFNLDEVAAAAEADWNKLLRRVEVEGGSHDDEVKFYTNLYRVYSAKAMVDDADGGYRDACGEVRKVAAPADHVYSSDAMWGAQWTVGPVWALLTPELTNSYINFMTMEAERDGWLPYAPVNMRYAPIMAAQHQVALVAGAWQKGIRGFDGEAAYAAVHKVLTEPGVPYTCGGKYPQGFAGDRHLAAYTKLGYVPEEVGPASSTFEYAFDDACGAVLAESLGKSADAESFAKAAQSWRNGIMPQTHYAERRRADGTWLPNPDTHRFGTTGGWNGPGFVEGSSWLYTWFVPHDVPGLIDTLGASVFNARLEEGFKKKYVDLTNEPNLQSPWLFNYSGRPWLAQRYARDVFSRVFDTSPLNGWPGEEDEGQMGAYVVLAGVGLFDMEGGCAKQPAYQISGPAFRSVVLHLSGADFEIDALNNSAENVYIQSANLNGRALDRLQIAHADVVRGGRLVLRMGPQPRF